MNKFPDINKIIKDTAVLDESLSQYESRNADGSISFVVSQPGASNYYSTNTGRSFLDSSVPDVQSEEETEDEDDDELMAWVAKGLLPANVDTTLALNQAYQEVMEQFIRHVESILFRVRERHRAVQEIVDKKCQSTVTNRPHKVPAQMYMYPYFRDSAEMCPPMNEEAKRKLYEGEYFDMLVEPPLKWSINEKNLLTKAVKDFCLQSKIRPITNQQEIFNEKPKLSKEKKAKMKTNLSELKKLEKQQDRLKEAANITFSEDDDWTDIDWHTVSTCDMNGVKSATECRLMWNNQLLPTLNHGSWSQEELSMLKKLAVSNNARNWEMIADKLKTGRSAFECAEKFQMELNDNLIKSDWTTEEDEVLIDAVERVRIGEYIPWDQVLVFLEGRTKLQVLNRWRRSVNPKLKHGRWSFDEDKMLMEALHKFAKRDWVKIAEHVGTRSDSQCRDRWVSVLNSHVKNEPWTAKEDATLLMGVKTFGIGSWAPISKLLPGRTGSACKIRYKMLDKKGTTDVKNINASSEEVVEKRVTSCRRQHQIQRKEKVHRWFTSNYGDLPKQGDKDVSKFIDSLSPQIRNIVSRKLGIIHRTFGSTVVKREAAASTVSAKSLTVNNNRNNVQENVQKESASSVTTEQRRRAVDQEMMSILHNNRWPTVCSYPSSRKKTKEEQMKAVLAKTLLEHKILPPSKSTLIGFKGLLLERSDLTASVDQANPPNPLLMESDIVLRNYFADKEVIGEKQHTSLDANQVSDDRISSRQQSKFLSDDVLESLINSTSFKNAEATFRSLFLWPAIMSNLEGQKEG